MRFICAIAAFWGLAVTAWGGVSAGFTLETRWIAVNTPAQLGPRGMQLPAGTVVNASTNQAFIGNDYRQRFELQARITNVVGQENLGVYVISGDINTTGVSMSDAVIINKDVASIPGLGRSGFFSNGRPEIFGLDGSPSDAGRIDSITHLEAFGPITVTNVWTYNFDTNSPNPFPGPPPPLRGAENDWAPVYRLMVDIRPEDVSGNGFVTIDFSFNESEGYSSSTGVREWLQFIQPGSQFPPPNEFNTATEVVWYPQFMSGNHGEGNHSDIEIPAAFRLNVIPAPTTAGLLGAAGLAKCRRRRC